MSRVSGVVLGLTTSLCGGGTLFLVVVSDTTGDPFRASSLAALCLGAVFVGIGMGAAWSAAFGGEAKVD